MVFYTNKQIVSVALVASFSSTLVIGNAQVTATESFAHEASFLNTEMLVAQAFDPPNEGEPTHTVGGASRGSCNNINFSKINIQHTSSSFSAQFPSDAAVSQVFFSLRDSGNNTLHQGFVQVQDAQVSIGDNAFSGVNTLQDDYTWSMAIICDRALRPDSPVLTGNL